MKLMSEEEARISDLFRERTALQREVRARLDRIEEIEREVLLTAAEMAKQPAGPKAA